MKTELGPKRVSLVWLVRPASVVVAALIGFAAVSVSFAQPRSQPQGAREQSKTEQDANKPETEKGAETDPGTEAGTALLPLEVKLDELVIRFEEGSDADKTFAIPELEVNEYLRLRSTAELPEGIEDPWIRFAAGFAIIGAMLDMDRVKGEMPDSFLLALLTGKVPVELTARFQGEAGVGNLVLEQVLLGGVELPPSFVEAIAAQHDTTGILPEGFRLGEPFPLPYDVESIRIEPGNATVHQRATSIQR